MGFIDLEKAYDRVNREALWRVLRMYDVGGKLLSGIKSMYVEVLIRPLVNARNMQLEYSRVLHETLLVHVLKYGKRRYLELGLYR